MLIWFLSRGRDFNEMVRRRIIMSGGILFLGGLALVLSGTLLRESGLPDFAQGVYSGVGAGLVGCGVGLLLHSFWLQRHPERARTEFIRENDERERLVNDKAAKWSFYTVFFGLLPALMISAPVNLTVFWTLFIIFICMGIGFLACLPLARRIL